jgi:hypothetical protein
MGMDVEPDQIGIEVKIKSGKRWVIRSICRFGRKMRGRGR